MGLSTFWKILSRNAEYLNFESAFEGHCFRRSFDTHFANNLRDFLFLKGHRVMCVKNFL